MGHKFENKKYGDTTYAQCVDCHKVMLNNDIYFNMVCHYQTQRLSDLRSRLENSPQ